MCCWINRRQEGFYGYHSRPKRAIDEDVRVRGQHAFPARLTEYCESSSDSRQTIYP